MTDAGVDLAKTLSQLWLLSPRTFQHLGLRTRLPSPRTCRAQSTFAAPVSSSFSLIDSSLSHNSLATDMAEASTEYSQAVNRLHASFRALQHAGDLLKQKGHAEAKTEKHLPALKAHIARFLKQTWPPRVLIGIAKLYMDVASVTKWYLESGMTDILAMFQMSGIDVVFVSLWRSVWLISGTVPQLICGRM